VNTNIAHHYPSQLIDWPERWSTNWSDHLVRIIILIILIILIRSSCKNYHPLSSLYCIAGEPARLVPGQHCWQCTFSRGNIVDTNILRKKYSQQYCRRRTFYQDCVFEEYLCIFSLYLMIYDRAVCIIRYPCIFSLHVECHRSWKSLIDGPSWWIFWSITWADQKINWWFIFWSITWVDQKINWWSIFWSITWVDQKIN